MKSINKIALQTIAITVVSLMSLVSMAEVLLKTEVFKVVQIKNDKGQLIENWQAPDNMLPGDTAGYKISFTNNGKEAASDIVLNNDIPQHTVYRKKSAQGKNSNVQFSVDGKQFASADKLTVTKNGKKKAATEQDYQAVRWTLKQPLAAGISGSVQYQVTIK